MSDAGDLVTWAILALIFGGVAAFYLWRLMQETRGFLNAMVRLRDRIDRARRW